MEDQFAIKIKCAAIYQERLQPNMMSFLKAVKSIRILIGINDE